MGHRLRTLWAFRGLLAVSKSSLNQTPTPSVLSPVPASGPVGDLDSPSSTSSCPNRWLPGSHPSCPPDNWSPLSWRLTVRRVPGQEPKAVAPGGPVHLPRTHWLLPAGLRPQGLPGAPSVEVVCQFVICQVLSPPSLSAFFRWFAYASWCRNPQRLSLTPRRVSLCLDRGPSTIHLVGLQPPSPLASFRPSVLKPKQAAGVS